MRKKNVFYLFSIAVLSLLIFYCVFHTTLSNNSVFSIKLLEKKIEKHEKALSSLNNKIQKLQNKIDLISDPDNPNIDFLDEEARRKLGVKKKNENYNSL